MDVIYHTTEAQIGILTATDDPCEALVRVHCQAGAQSYEPSQVSDRGRPLDHQTIFLVGA